jgi:hypothetical protein
MSQLPSKMSRRKRPTTPGYSQQSYWLPADIRDRIREIAKVGHVSMSEIAEDALTRYLDAYQTHGRKGGPWKDPF